MQPPPAPATQHPAVAALNLTKSYGSVTAVRGVSFAVRAGTIAAFLGPNGAGKSTTMRMLLGLVEPSGGEARLFGRRYADLDEPARSVGAVLESGDFHPDRSGYDHLRTLAILGGIAPDRIEEMLDLVGLAGEPARRRVGTYSLGMRQRLGLAGALLGDPALLILDEPANGLDPAGIHWLRRTLRALAERGRTVLVATHVLAEVAQVADHVIALNAGQVVADGSLDQFTQGGKSLEARYLEVTGGVP